MKKLFRYASLLIAAAVLFSCEGTVDPSDNPGNTDNPGNENPGNTDNPGEGQGNTNKPGGGNEDEDVLRLVCDKTYMQTYGDDYVTVTATLGKEVITDGVVFYNGDNEPIELEDSKFRSTEVGEHVIWASYLTYVSEKIVIKAVDVPIPATPEDPQPDNTSFKTRVLVSEFTATGCMYCPSMKTLMHDVLEMDGMADKVVLVECHSSRQSTWPKDPAYIKTGFESFCQSEGLPHVNCDMYNNEIASNYLMSEDDVAKLFNDLCSVKEDYAAGLSVNSTVKDGKLVMKVTMKAVAKGEYRIGAFLLEDNIYGKQSSATEDWHHYHNNVIRYIDSQFYMGTYEQYFGHSVGVVDAGKTVDYLFVWDLDEIWEKGSNYGNMYGGTDWDPFKLEDMHAAVFVSALASDSKGNEFYFVNNVIDCPIDGETLFDYK